MKKILAFLTVIVTLTSCSQVENTLSDSENELGGAVSDTDNMEAEQLSDAPNGYKFQELPLPPGADYIFDLVQFPDASTIYIRGGRREANRYSTGIFATTNTIKDQNSFHDFYYDRIEGYDTADYAYDNVIFNSDQSFYVITTFEDHGGMHIPDNSEERNDFDWDTYSATCSESFYLSKFDCLGKNLFTVPFEYPAEVISDYGYPNVGSMIGNCDCVLFSSFNGRIYRISENGDVNEIFRLEGESSDIYTPSLMHDRDNKTIIILPDTSIDNPGDQSERSISYCELGENDIVDEPFYIEDSEFAFTDDPAPGRGKYRLLFPEQDGLYGLTDENKTEKIIDYEDTGISYGKTIAIDDNVYLSIMNDSKGNSKLIKILPREPGENKDRIEITLSTPSGYTPTDMINSFNNSQSIYQVKSVAFQRSDDEMENWSANNNALNMAIISGEATDIIFDLPYSTYENFSHKGLFTDLYPLMESDPAVNKNTLLPNVLKASESSDGALYGIYSHFGVASMLAKTRVCDKVNWTFDEMMELYENPPVDAVHRYDSDSKMDIFRSLFYCMDDLIDYDTATCDFESENFKKLLEFSDRFVNDVNSPDKFTEGAAAVDNYYYEKYRWFGNDAVLTQMLSLDFPLHYQMIKYLQGNGEDMTIVGYPSSDGTGGRISPYSIMAITRNCENKDGAWAFISYYIQHAGEDDPYNEYGDGGLPVMTEKFIDFMDHTMNANRTANGDEIPNFTQEDRDMIVDYIKGCTKLVTRLDEDVMNVCDEEAQLYFNGEQTLDEAAEHIQNRASIIISEKS